MEFEDFEVFETEVSHDGEHWMADDYDFVVETTEADRRHEASVETGMQVLGFAGIEAILVAVLSVLLTFALHRTFTPASRKAHAPPDVHGAAGALGSTGSVEGEKVRQVIASIKESISSEKPPQMGTIEAIRRLSEHVADVLNVQRAQEPPKPSAVRAGSASLLSQAELQELEGILQSMTHLLSHCANLVREAEPQGATLADHLAEVDLLEAIAALEASTESLKDEVHSSLGALVAITLRKCAFDLRVDLQDGKQMVQAALSILAPPTHESSCPTGVDLPTVQMELEVLTRRTVANAEVLRVYDRFQDYESLYSDALVFVRTAYQAIDSCLRSMRSEATQPALQAIAPFPAESSAHVADREKPRPPPSQLDGDGEERVRNVPLSDLVTLPSAQALLLSPASEKEMRVREMDAKQKRVEIRSQAERDAEARYRQDEQTERAERNGLAGILVQRSMLQNSNKALLSQLRQERTALYEAKLAMRNNIDGVVCVLVAIASSVLFIAVAYGCADGLTITELLTSKTMELCRCVTDSVDVGSTAATGDPISTMSLGAVDRAFKATLQKGMSAYKSHFQKFFTWSAVAIARDTLGFDIAYVSDMGALALCLGRFVLKSVIPMVTAKILDVMGFTLLSTWILGFTLVYGLGLPLLSITGVLQQLAFILVAQVMVYIAVRFIDSNLRWSVSGTNLRPVLLYLFYPALCVAAALVVACEISDKGLSRGLKIGRRQGWLECASVSIQKCSRR